MSCDCHSTCAARTDDFETFSKISDSERRGCILQATAHSPRNGTYCSSDTSTVAFYTPESSALLQSTLAEPVNSGPRAAAALFGDPTTPCAGTPASREPDAADSENSPGGPSAPVAPTPKPTSNVPVQSTVAASSPASCRAADSIPDTTRKQVCFARARREGYVESKRGLGQRSLLSEAPGAKRPRLPAEAGDDARARADAMTDAELPPAGQKQGRMYDVVLRIEFMKSGEVKALSFLMVGVLITGISVTIYMKIRATSAGTSWYMVNSDTPQFRDNYITGIVISAISGTLLVTYIVRGLWFRVRRLRWDHRRHRVYMLRFAELLAATIGFCCWAYASSARRLVEDCGRFNNVMLWTYVIRLSCINSLLCIWTMSARGMTVHRGGAVTPRQRFQLWVKAKASRYMRERRIRNSREAAAAAAAAAIGGGGMASGGASPAAAAVVVGSAVKDEAEGPDGSTGADGGDGGVGSGTTGAVAAPKGQTTVTLVGCGARPHQPVNDVDVAAVAAAAAAPAAVAMLAVELLGPDAAAVGIIGDGDKGEGKRMPADESVMAAAQVAAEAAATAATAEAINVAATLRAPGSEADPGPATGPATTPFRVPVSAAPSVSVCIPVPEDAPVPSAPSMAQQQQQPSMALSSPFGDQLSASSVPSAVFANSATGAAAAVAAAAAAAVAQAHGGTSAFTTAAAYRAAKHAAMQVAEEAGADEELYIDAPWYEYLAPVSYLWVPFECLVGLYTALLASNIKRRTQQSDCLEWFLECRIADRKSLLLLCLLLFCQTLYLVIYFAYCIKAFIHLRSRSYVLYRELNIYLSLEVRLRGVALVFLLANEFVQALYVPTVDMPDGSKAHCRFSLDVVLGFWSTQVVTMALVSIVAWMFVPRGIKGDMPIMQSTLQRFSWMECDLGRQLALRLASVPPHFNRVSSLLREPMFCFETAVKLTYWCEHAYYYDEPGCSMRLPVETLLNLYDLQEVTVIRNVDSDAKVLIAWSSEQCLLCFRGTASLKAACVDLKAALVPYYQASAWRHKHRIAAIAAVHHGFQWSWIHGGFSVQVVDWVRKYREKHPNAKITVTGHSLGGAHATLCTLDIVHALGSSLPASYIKCYTFGSPRVGNHAFASLYNQEVQETWHVINGNDMVPLTPKCVFWFVYKHPGLKVIVKRRGDLIVRPTFTENAVARMPCSRSVRHHLLGSYIRSLMSVLRSQTRGKHVEGGVRGLLHLTNYNLPEVDAVLSDLVQEVQSVALAAVEALGSLSDARVTPSQAAIAAKVAAAAAGRGGDVVYHFMNRHGSIRLLMEKHASQVRPQAYGNEMGQPQEEVVSPPEPRFKTLLAAFIKRVNLGMTFMGVETGINDDDDYSGLTRPGGQVGHGAGPGHSRVGRSPQLPKAPSAGAAEMEAFEKAAAYRQAAIDRYRHNRSLARREVHRARRHHSTTPQDGQGHSVTSATATTVSAASGATGASVAGYGAGSGANEGSSWLWPQLRGHGCADGEAARGAGKPASNPAAAAPAAALAATAADPRARRRLYVLRRGSKRASAGGAAAPQPHEQHTQVAARAPSQPTAPPLEVMQRHMQVPVSPAAASRLSPSEGELKARPPEASGPDEDAASTGLVAEGIAHSAGPVAEAREWPRIGHGGCGDCGAGAFAYTHQQTS